AYWFPSRLSCVAIVATRHFEAFRRADVAVISFDLEALDAAHELGDDLGGEVDDAFSSRFQIGEDLGLEDERRRIGEIARGIRLLLMELVYDAVLIHDNDAAGLRMIGAEQRHGRQGMTRPCGMGADETRDIQVAGIVAMGDEQW